MLYFRVDANPEIATGHAMRCMSVAAAARDQNIESIFIVSDEWGRNFIEEKGYPVHCLYSDWNQKEKELPDLSAYLKEQKASLLIVDSYQVTDAYIEKLREFVKVAYIDDVDMLHTAVDCLINYNNYGASQEYRERYRVHLGEGATLLLGCGYAPLREEFCKVSPTFSREVRGIFLTTGGADKYHIALQLTEELLHRNLGIDIHVIAGSFQADKDRIRALAEGNLNCILHENVTNMSEIMKECDIAISAGGSTTYELCACGLPMILFSFADNQMEIVRTHDKLGTAIYCGDYREEKENLITRIADEVCELINNTDKRANLHEKCKMLVDAKGASRIVEKLVEAFL